MEGFDYSLAMKTKVTYKKNGVKYFAVVAAVHPNDIQLAMLKRGVGMSQVIKTEKMV